MKQNQFRFIILIIFAIFSNHQYTYSQTTYGGIGATINIDEKSKFPFIVTVSKGMPAEKMNLVPNDFIIKINGQSTYNYTIEQVVSQLRGVVGSTCSITIWRNNVEYDLTYTRVAIVESVCNIYTNALPAFTSYIWDGTCINGFADGYGKLQLINDGNFTSYYVGNMKAGKLEGDGVYHYSNGHKMLEGRFRNNQLNGNGKKYDANGNLKFEGFFENDELSVLKNEHDEFNEVAKLVVNEIFDGGTNIKQKIVGFRRYDSNRKFGNDNAIIEVKITFNGDFVKSNYYEVTLRLVYNFNESDLQFIDLNDMAKGYGIGKLAFKLGMLARKIENLRK